MEAGPLPRPMPACTRAAASRRTCSCWSCAVARRTWL